MAATGGALVLLAGAATTARAGRWAAPARRYERPQAAPRDAWEALDRGEDPTV